MKNMKIYILAISLGFLFLNLLKADGKIDIAISPQPLIKDDPAQLFISSATGITPVIAEYPDSKDIEWLPGASRSTRTNIINGKRSVTAISIYNIRPLKEGTLIIPPFTINLGGKMIKTEQL